jgi:hypothetical protein
MMAAGLERQLDRCSSGSIPDFCNDSSLYAKAKSAYNHLWDLIEANSSQLSQEVWSWIYQDGGFKLTPLGALPPPQGQSPTGKFILCSGSRDDADSDVESDIRQLWSLTFLAVTRNKNVQ